MNAASSSRQRRSRMTRPASMRPITGIGNARKARASASTAAPDRCRKRPQGQRRARQQRHRERAAADLAVGFDQSRSRQHRARRARRREAAALQAPGSRSAGRDKQPQRRQALGEPIGIGVEPQHGFERREPDLVEAQRPFQRVARELPDQFGAADDEPRLRAAQQFVAAERDEVGARASASATVGSCGNPQRSKSTSEPLPRSSTNGIA